MHRISAVRDTDAAARPRRLSHDPHHLKKLREAGLLESERRGSWVYYRVSPGVLGVMARLLAPAAS